MNRRTLGSAGEYDAHDYLIGRGYRILAMNYRRPTGEIDVIARDGGAVVFIEVKRRTTLRYGRPAEAVTPAKRRSIVRTAMYYIAENRLQDQPVRFDVIELMPGKLNHIECAFDATSLVR